MNINQQSVNEICMSGIIVCLARDFRYFWYIKHSFNESKREN